MEAPYLGFRSRPLTDSDLGSDYVPACNHTSSTLGRKGVGLEALEPLRPGQRPSIEEVS